MPDDAGDKKVADLTAKEIAAEMQRITDRQSYIKRLLMSSANFKPGETVEERLKKLTASGWHPEASGGLLVGGLFHHGKDNPKLREAEVQARDAQGNRIISKAGDLADEYQALNKRSQDIEQKLKDSQSLTDEVKDETDKNNAGPTFDTQDDPTNFTGTFLSDQGIEDLARSGQFDIGPKDIAALMPTAAVQQAENDQDATTNPSLIDQLQPAQYKNSDFVHVGSGFALSDPSAMQKNQINDADLPDWEKKILLSQVDQQAPNKLPTSQAEYDAARQKIMDEANENPEMRVGIGIKLAALANQYQAAKSNTGGNASLRDIISKPFGMTSSEVSSAAVQLFKAGYLNVPNYDPTKPLSAQMAITSAFDPNFQKAWKSWVGDSFKDRSKTMMEILQENQTNFMGQLQLYADQINEKNAKNAKANTIQVTDAASIRKNADQLAQQQIGRALTDVEHEQLVGYIHNLEQSSQQAVINGQSLVENVDPQARLAEKIDADHPVESMATSTADEYNYFRQLIAGPRGAV